MKAEIVGSALASTGLDSSVQDAKTQIPTPCLKSDAPFRTYPAPARLDVRRPAPDPAIVSVSDRRPRVNRTMPPTPIAAGEHPAYVGSRVEPGRRCLRSPCGRAPERRRVVREGLVVRDVSDDLLLDVQPGGPGRQHQMQPAGQRDQILQLQCTAVSARAMPPSSPVTARGCSKKADAGLRVDLGGPFAGCVRDRDADAEVLPQADVQAPPSMSAPGFHRILHVDGSPSSIVSAANSKWSDRDSARLSGCRHSR